MDIYGPGGYFPKRIKLVDGAIATLMSFPYKAKLAQNLKPSTVVEYEQIGGTLQRRELLEYPEDPTQPAYVKERKASSTSSPHS